MDLLRFFRLSRNNSEQILEAANEVVLRVEEAVWKRVLGVASTLNRYERKGYVLARAAVLLDAEVTIALDRDARLSPRDRQQVAHSASETLLENINQRLSAPIETKRAA